MYHGHVPIELGMKVSVSEFYMDANRITRSRLTYYKILAKGSRVSEYLLQSCEDGEQRLCGRRDFRISKNRRKADLSR